MSFSHISHLISPISYLISHISNLQTIFIPMLNLSMLISFLKHRFKAKTRHGVHSPFVYRLLDEVIYDFRAQTVYQEIEQLRAELLQYDPRNSLVKKNTLTQPRLAQLVHRLVCDLKPKNIIELGTCHGITTTYLAKAATEARVISIDDCPETLAIARENMKKLQIINTELLLGNFDEILPKIIEEIPLLDFVVIEGHHLKEDTLNYFKWCLPKIGENSLLIFADIYWNQGMKEAWEEIKANPEVSVTIDLFYIGLVFFKKGRVKEDFRIRF